MPLKDRAAAGSRLSDQEDAPHHQHAAEAAPDRRVVRLESEPTTIIRQYGEQQLAGHHQSDQTGRAQPRCEKDVTGEIRGTPRLPASQVQHDAARGCWIAAWAYGQSALTGRESRSLAGRSDSL
jgi:hypothetical protein